MNGDLVRLKSLRYKFPKNIILSYLNINSVRNKLSDLGFLIGELVDILSIGETKIDDSFPSSQLYLPNFKAPYRLDITSQSGGLLTFVRNVPSRKLTDLTDFKIPSDIQIITIELNLKNRKRLLFSVYKPPKQYPRYFLDKLSDAILLLQQIRFDHSKW